MLLSSFVGSIPPQNIKIVLTHAKGTPEERNKRITSLKSEIEYRFKDFPPEIKKQVSNISILAINNHHKPEKRTPLPSDISPFQPNPVPAIDPRRFSPKGYSLTEEIIVEKGFIDKKTFDGIQIIATLVHRKRTKFTSFDKKTTTYSEWENIDGQKPRSLCIQNAEYGKQEEEENEINETQDNTKIKRTIHYLFRKKRFQRKKYNKKEKQGETEESTEVFYELTDPLNVDGHTITFTESKTEEDITTFYSTWYIDPNSEIKYEIQEITRSFEKILESGDTKTKIFGEEMRILKIDYKKDQSGEWQKCEPKIEQEWHATKTNQNFTTTETRNQESDKDEYYSNPERHIKIHKAWEEERTVTFHDNEKKTQSPWRQVPGTEKTTTITTETQYRSESILNQNPTYTYYTKTETKYEALEVIKKVTYHTTYREKREITSIDGTITDETAWNRIPNSEEKYTIIQMYEIKGTKDKSYIRKHSNGSFGTHYNYFGINHYSPFFGIESRFIRRIYKNGSSSPIEEHIGNWTKLDLSNDIDII